MGRKPFRTPDKKLAIVRSVLIGETTQVEAACRLEMSQTTIAKWQKQFLEGGRESLARGDNAISLASRREKELATQVDDLTTAIGEADVELRLWRISSSSSNVGRAPLFRRSRSGGSARGSGSPVRPGITGAPERSTIDRFGAGRRRSSTASPRRRPRPPTATPPGATARSGRCSGPTG